MSHTRTTTTTATAAEEKQQQSREQAEQPCRARTSAICRKIANTFVGVDCRALCAALPAALAVAVVVVDIKALSANRPAAAANRRVRAAWKACLCAHRLKRRAGESEWELKCEHNTHTHTHSLAYARSLALTCALSGLFDRCHIVLAPGAGTVEKGRTRKLRDSLCLLLSLSVHVRMHARVCV